MKQDDKADQPRSVYLGEKQQHFCAIINHGELHPNPDFYENKMDPPLSTEGEE